MRPAADRSLENVPPFSTSVSEAALGEVEARVLSAVEEYNAAIHAGQKPNRHEFLARHAAIAGPLAKCLDGLEFVNSVAPELSGFGADGIGSAAEEVQPSGPLGDYQIVREVGRGGMGVVYEAVQISLGRRVALKVLPFAATLDAKQLQRFKNEAQAAAHLHHQNIVPVYAVGCERGVHYYAMQFIEGQTLAGVISDLRKHAGLDAMDSAALRKPAASEGAVDPKQTAVYPVLPLPSESRAGAASTQVAATLSTERSTKSPAFFRTVARLGVQVAEALEHAHQLGIIHRDIKPANLLVDVRGNLWITDFGLAHCQSQVGLTMTGDLLGTLRYMSPEQALGQRAAVDARADIYSLGITLYELLTLQPAYDGRNREELLRQIAFEEPRLPRRLNRAVPTELETIVFKAIAKNPEERYPAARELVDDLERFLNDVPIRARRPTVVQRAGKWARRHRGVVWSAAVVVAVAVVALTAGTVLIWQAKGRTEAALARAREQERVAQENGAQAETRQRQAEAAYVAETIQRKQAEANARLAWQTFPDELFTQALQVWGAGRPELAEARRKALLNALRFYETFARENRHNPALRVETAKAFCRIGDIRSRFEQHREAEEAYQQAMDIQQKLAGDLPAVPAYRQDLAASHNNLGRLFEHIGRVPEAEQAYRQALALAEKLVADSPSETARASLAIARLNLGNVLELTGQTRKAEETFRKALAAQEKLVAEFPEAPAHRRELASSQNSLGFVLWTHRRSRDAERLFLAARDLLKPLATDSTDPTYRAKLAGTQRNLGILRAAIGRSGEAEAGFREALTICEKLAADFPMVPNYRHDLARSRIHLAEVLVASGRPGEAEQALGQALTALKALATDLPAVPRFRETLAAAHEHQAALWVAAGQTRQAEQAYRRALSLRQQQTDAVPQVPSYRGFQATTYHNLGILLQNEKRYQEADATYRNGLAILEKLVADFPDEPDFRHRLAALQNSRGTLFGATGRAQQAEAVYRQALTVLEKLTDEFPADTGFRHKQAIGHLNLGNLLTLAGRPREAVKAYRQGRKIDPANAALCDALAWLLATCPDAKVNDASQAVELGKRAVELAPKAGAYWKTLGMAHLGVGDFKAVVQAFERSVDLRKGGESLDWFYLAVAHAQLGDKDKASRYYQKGVQWMEEHRPKDEGLRRFRAKVEQLLRLPEKKQQ